MTDNIITALAKALPDVGAAIKDSANPAFRSKYADLGSVIEAIRPVAQHGLWFRQSAVPLEGQRAGVETFYIHTSGQELSAGITDAPVSKNDAQGYGSALTYCRRYGLMAAFGIAPEDDDGNAASKAAPVRRAASPAPPRELPANVNPEPDEPGGEEDVAAKVADWCDKQAVELDAIAKSANAPLLQIWHTKNSKALLRLKASHEAQYEKLMALYDDVYSMLGKADAGPLPITFAA